MRIPKTPLRWAVCLAVICFVVPASRVVSDDDASGVWSDDWQATMLAAQAAETPKPVIIKFEAAWCGPCKALTAALKQPAVVELLSDWHRVRVDVDQPPDGVEVDDVSALPTIRVLSTQGAVLMERVGLLTDDELIAWLRAAETQFDAARRQAEFVRQLGTEQIGQEQTDLLLQMLANKSPQLRATAAAVLIQHPQHFAVPVADVFVSGPLRTKVAALDVLQRWSAPLEGLDPWEPASLDDERLTKLKQWAASAAQQDAALVSSPPSPQQLAEFDLELDRLVRRGEPRAGLIDTLALAGPHLLPRVRARLANEVTDDARERLTAVRYRLAADPTLPFRLDSIPDRLASNDIDVRRTAAKQLSEQAGKQDLDLLEALFGHNDALVRELALRGMQKAAGGQVARLTKLLEDPDKNVRATVLKVWLDNPDASVLEAASEYAATETDPDLLVYVARLLKELKADTPSAVAALNKLSEHDDWQVRAEVAAAISHFVTDGERSVRYSDERDQSMPTALREIGQRLLRDSDSFVLSQIVPAMIGADQTQSFDRLLEIAWKYPEIRKDVLPNLNANLGRQKVEFLTERFESDVSNDRVFAIDALDRFQAQALDEVLPRALDDPDVEVQRSAARALIAWLDRYHAAINVLPPEVSEADMYERMMEEEALFAEFEAEQTNTGVLGLLGSLFGSSDANVPAVPNPEAVPVVPAAVPAVPAAVPAVPEAVPDIPIEQEPPDPIPAQPAGDEPLETAIESYAAAADQAATADPAADETAEARAKYQRWLAEWQSAPATEVPWLSGVAENLSKLKAEQGDPSGVLTLALVRLGVAFEQEAMVKALQAYGTEAAWSNLYPWLNFEDRQQLFLSSARQDDASDHLPLLVDQARRYDPGYVQDWYWQALDLLSLPALEHSYQLTQKLMLVTTGQEHFSPFGEESSADQFTAEFLTRLDSIDNPAGQLVALSVLSRIDAAQVPELVGDRYLDSSINESLQRDWARLAIKTRELSAATELATQWITDDRLRTVALNFLAGGYDGISSTENGWMSIGDGGDLPQPSGLLDVPVIPPGIDIAAIRPLLRSDDIEIAAQATYILLVLGEDTDLQPLVTAAQKEEASAYLQPMTAMLVGAIAIRNLDDQVPLLEEIYKRLREEPYYVSEFYWKIRIMTGPEALRLRREIREDVGVDALF